jgi:hypothetical protein
MALTERKIKDLQDKAFDELYDQHKAEWVKLAKAAQKHAQEHITGGNKPRPDDVAKALHPMLEVHEILRAHQEENAARGKRFVEWFVEYVIDQSL